MKIVASFSIVALLVVVFFAQQFSKTAVPAPSKFTHPLTIGTTALLVAYAVSPVEQDQGLSGTPPLAADQGMLFLFPSATKLMFWMKDMNYSLDIIWIGADKRVVDVSKNLAPDTYPKIFSPKLPAQYALEVSSGFAEAHDVVPGTVVSF